MADNFDILSINKHEKLPTNTAYNKINVLVEDNDLTGANEVHKKMNLQEMRVYQIPASGIPENDLDSGVKAKLAKAAGAQAKNVYFEVTLTAGGWVAGEQTITNSNFNTTDNYRVAPKPSDYRAYQVADIYAKDVTVASKMTFACEVTPLVDIHVYISKEAN